MWRQQLENEGFPTLYFNARENDFVEDPLSAFIGEVEGYIHSKSADNDSQTRKLFIEAKNIGKTLIAKSLPVAAKIAVTYGILIWISYQNVQSAMLLKSRERKNRPI
ncbi:MAG: hypothetical protein R3C41_04585 [Calditrichia bacterium]